MIRPPHPAPPVLFSHEQLRLLLLFIMRLLRRYVLTRLESMFGAVPLVAVPLHAWLPWLHRLPMSLLATTWRAHVRVCVDVCVCMCACVRVCVSVPLPALPLPRLHRLPVLLPATPWGVERSRGL